MTPEEMQARIEQLEVTLAQVEEHARNADGLVALLVGMVANMAGVGLEIDKDDMPGAAREWTDLIIDRFEMGQNTDTDA
jgi:hypothetical protein